MSGKIVNLNKARKARAKTAGRKTADENAVKFGRTKAQKTLEEAQNAKSKAHLDQSKLERGTPDDT